MSKGSPVNGASFTTDPQIRRRVQHIFKKTHSSRCIITHKATWLATRYSDIRNDPIIIV